MPISSWWTSPRDGLPQDMARIEAGLDDAARGLGCRLPWPVMYLIFLSITAIPDYAITDLGLIDCVSLQAISPPP